MKFKIIYERTAIHEMIVEAETREEAKKKYEEFDVIEDHEMHALSENITSIREVK